MTDSMTVQERACHAVDWDSPDWDGQYELVRNSARLDALRAALLTAKVRVRNAQRALTESGLYSQMPDAERAAIQREADAAETALNAAQDNWIDANEPDGSDASDAAYDEGFSRGISDASEDIDRGYWSSKSRKWNDGYRDAQTKFAAGPDDI